MCQWSSCFPVSANSRNPKDGSQGVEHRPAFLEESPKPEEGLADLSKRLLDIEEGFTVTTTCSQEMLSEVAKMVQAGVSDLDTRLHEVERRVQHKLEDKLTRVEQLHDQRLEDRLTGVEQLHDQRLCNLEKYLAEIAAKLLVAEARFEVKSNSGTTLSDSRPVEGERALPVQPLCLHERALGDDERPAGFCLVESEADSQERLTETAASKLELDVDKGSLPLQEDSSSPSEGGNLWHLMNAGFAETSAHLADTEDRIKVWAMDRFHEKPSKHTSVKLADTEKRLRDWAMDRFSEKPSNHSSNRQDFVSNSTARHSVSTVTSVTPQLVLNSSSGESSSDSEDASPRLPPPLQAAGCERLATNPLRHRREVSPNSDTAISKQLTAGQEKNDTPSNAINLVSAKTKLAATRLNNNPDSHGRPMDIIPLEDVVEDSVESVARLYETHLDIASVAQEAGPIKNRRSLSYKLSM